MKTSYLNGLLKDYDQTVEYLGLEHCIDPLLLFNKYIQKYEVKNGNPKRFMGQDYIREVGKCYDYVFCMINDQIERYLEFRKDMLSRGFVEL